VQFQVGVKNDPQFDAANGVFVIGSDLSECAQ
jgi:hypothetical protein